MIKNYINAVSAILLVYCFCNKLYSQQTYTFTHCNAVGNIGPTQGQVNTAYLSTNLNGSVVSTAGIQSWTVPLTGLYEIDIHAASGGTPTSYTTRVGGLGARVRGEFILTQGDVLQILVGQVGSQSGGSGGGGGDLRCEKWKYSVNSSWRWRWRIK